MRLEFGMTSAISLEGAAAAFMAATAALCWLCL